LHGGCEEVGKLEGDRESTLGFVDLLRDDYVEKDRSRAPKPKKEEEEAKFESLSFLKYGFFQISSVCSSRCSFDFFRSGSISGSSSI
jgi:hypothetical protein